MSFKTLTPELGAKKMSRVLIIGAPNTFKTTAIVRTFPRPTQLMSYPGEGGVGTLPIDQPDLKAYVWEDEDPSKVSYTQQINEIEKTTWEILMGKYGEVKTFAGEGLHKLAGLYWNRAYAQLCEIYSKQIEEGKTDRNGVPLSESLKLEAYGNERKGATHDVLQYIHRVNQSNVDTVVFTCWEGVEQGQYGGNKELEANAKPHIFAELPGRLARFIVGEFGVVVFSEVGLPGPDGKSTGTWQIRKAGVVWGVGVKVPYEIALGLPARVPQDWSKLYPLLLGPIKQAK